MKKYRLIKLAAAALCAAAMPVNAFAANIVFKGATSADSAGGIVTVALYAPDADLQNIKAEDIRYIEQTSIASDGTFSITLPVTAEIAAESIAVSNLAGRVSSKDIPLYCSEAGSENGDGTVQNPYSLQKALEMAEDGGRVVVNGKIIVPADFVWPVSDKTVTVSGMNDAVIDIRTVGTLDIGCNTTFEKLTFGCEKSGTAISANGYHVIISETVKTDNPLASLRGGSATKDVASTNLEVYGGDYMKIYGGGSAHNVSGDCRLTVGGNVNAGYSVIDSDSNYLVTAVHGGCWGGVVKGDCITTMKDNAKAAYVYGGSNGTATSHVEGKIQVNIQGGNYMNVFAACFVTEGKRITSEINMTGGTVEGLFASDKNIAGDITMNILGGTVTRRIYGGCYNDWGFSFSTNYYVDGSINVIMGSEVNFDILTSLNSGIFGGSRCETNHADEISKLIFIDGAYDKFKALIGEQGPITVCASHHDYLVAATSGGSVIPSGAAELTLTPDAGYSVTVNGTEHEGGAYALTQKVTNIEFTKIASELLAVEYNGGSVSVEYNADTDFSPVIFVAVYDESGALTAVSQAEITSGAGNENIELSCELDSGRSYLLRAMMWSSAEQMIPLCAPLPITIPAAG